MSSTVPTCPKPSTVAHANGLTFKVIDGSSNHARVARNVRQLTMADGTVWTVGLPIGWRGIEAAWHTTETPEETATRIAAYGASTRRRDRIQLGLRRAAATGDVCPLCEYFRCRCNGVQPQHPAGGAR